MPSYPIIRPKPPNFAELHTTLRAGNLVESVITKIPKLTGREDYVRWSDQVVTVFKFCGIEKILTGEWTQPVVIDDDTDSEHNARGWKALDALILLFLNLSDPVDNQVRHLTTSHDKWIKLKNLFGPTSTSITFHLLSTVNIHFDESIEFEDFVTNKREHNRLLGELGGTSLPDSYIAILIRSGLPERLKQTVAHIPDGTITTEQLIDVIRSRN